MIRSDVCWRTWAYLFIVCWIAWVTFQGWMRKFPFFVAQIWSIAFLKSNRYSVIIWVVRVFKSLTFRQWRCSFSAMMLLRLINGVASGCWCHWNRFDRAVSLENICLYRINNWTIVVFFVNIGCSLNMRRGRLAKTEKIREQNENIL